MNNLKEAAHYVLMIACALVVGFGARDAVKVPLPADSNQVAMPSDQALILPAEIELTVGEPKILAAQTLGKKVQWMPLDRELKIMPLNATQVWVVAHKPGTFRATAWTAYNGNPTPISVCICKAKEETEEKK